MTRTPFLSRLRAHHPWKQRRRRALRLERLEDRRLLATFLVNDLGDLGDYDLEDGTCSATFEIVGDDPPVVVPNNDCTLRAAGDNAADSPGVDTISFGVPAGSVIAASFNIGIGDNTTVNAPAGKIVMNGGGISAGSGNIIRNLVVTGGGDAIQLFGDNNLVVGCHLGVNLAGTAAAGNTVGIRVGGVNNTIGGTTAADRNIISGNTDVGVLIGSIVGGSANNQVIGNFIGTDITGALALGNGLGQTGNGGQGIRINNGSGNVIGGAGDAGNVISGNRVGVLIQGTGGNFIIGNKIGTDVNGTARIGNIEAIEVFNSPNNIIGGDLPGGAVEILGNVISGSIGDSPAGVFGAGVFIFGPTATGNRIQGNRIGTDITGLVAIPNQSDGVDLTTASGNFVGGTIAALRNIISGNLGDGVLIGSNLASGANNNVVEGNYIGVNATGTAALANGARGVHIDSNATGNRIGGDSGGARNIISGNNLDGVIIALATAANNVVMGNYIGTDVSGTLAVANERNGVFILNAPDNRVGAAGTSSFAGNLISGNLLAGVRIQGPDALRNIVEGNAIGTQQDETLRLANGGAGVHIVNAADNRVGTATALTPTHPNFPGNVISGNSGDGVKIEGATASGNFVGANLIGTTHTGLGSRGNIGNGIYILDAPNNRIGASKSGDPALSGNTVSANLNGIRIDGVTATGNMLGGNFVGTDFRGDLDDFLDNTVFGVWIDDAADNFVGGFVPEGTGGLQLPRNVIANNGSVGVQIDGATATGNRVQRNSIFANGDLGIDLGGDGISPNDDLDGDGNAPTSLPNRLQNFPSLFQLQQDNTLIGELRSTPNTSFTIDIYVSEKEDESGNGEGQMWIAETVITTDQNGLEFFDFHIEPALLRGKPVITATATDPDGNTSEFSGPLRLPDLEVTLEDFTAGDILRRGDRFVVPYDASVTNLGTLVATDALVRIMGNGLLVASHTVTLEPEARQNLDGEWDVTDLFPKGVLGAPTMLDLLIEADPLDAIPEMPVGVNTDVVEITVDPRPRITKIESEFKPNAYYLNGVSLTNRFDLTVDWNGDLDDSQIGADEQPVVHVFAGGTLIDSQVVANPFDKASVSIDLGNDLSPNDSPGLKLVQFRADTDLHFFFSEYETLQFNLFDSVDWINVDATTNPFWTVTGTPTAAQYDKTAVYKAGVFFPQLAAGTQGSFGIPQDRVGFAGGAFGPKIPQASLRAEMRSDKTGLIEGELKFEGEVAGKDVGASDFGSIGGAASGRVKGTFKIEGHDLAFDKVTATLRLDGNVTTPKVPFPPPASFIKAQGKISLGVDVTFDLVEVENPQTNRKEVGWKEDVILGLEPAAEAIFSAGQSGVATVEVGVGGRMRGEFKLDGDPCVEKSANLNFFARLKATFLVFAAQKTFTFPFLATACSGAAAGEGGSPLTQPRIFTDIDLVPRFVSPLADPEGETASVGLPAVMYPYAKPALARNADGTMTLVYVSEDPGKADGQHLEMFASTWDGAAWSSPVQLTDDTLLDDAPTVAYDASGNAVAMWTRLKNPVADAANTDPTTLLGDMEIVYAVRDATTQTWSPATPLTDNAAMDFLPQLQADAAGNLMAMWLRDDGNDSPIFPDDPTPLSADFVFAQWDGADWSSPAVALAGVAVNEAPQFALGNGSGLLIWSEDGDGNVVTDSDREIRTATWDGAAWSAPSVIAGTTDGLADVLPRVVYDSPDRAQVTWVKAGVPLSAEENDAADQLFFTQFQSDAFSNPVPALQADAISEPRIIVNEDDTFVVWQSYSETGPDIFYAVRDASGGDWSLPIPFTDSPALEWWFNPFINDDGQLEVLFLEREVGSEPAGDAGAAEGEPGDPLMVPTFTQSRLATAARTLGSDLTVLALDLSTPNPSPGSTVQVTVTVRNSGDFTTPTSSLVLRDDGVQVGSSLSVPELTAGESTQVVFDWTTPQNATAPHTLVAEVDPNLQLAEINETNNTASLLTLLPDLAVESVDTVLDNDTLTITAVITNQGLSPTNGSFDVRLRQDDAESSTSRGTQTVNGLLAPGGSSVVTFVINDAQATLGGPHTGFVIADTGAVIAEADESNNTGFGALDPRRLAVFGLPSSGSPFRVRRDDDSVVVTRQDGTELLREMLATLQRLTLPTPNGDQQVIVDYSGGDPIPVAGLVVISANGDDTLALQGGGNRNVLFHGGTGQNSLNLLSNDVLVDLTDPSQRLLTSIRELDVRGAGANTLTLDKVSVDEITDAANELRVLSNSDDTVNLGVGWTLTGTQVADGLFFRVLEQSGSRLLLNGPRDWLNPINPLDVNANGSVEPLDVLIIFNELNEPEFRDSVGLLVDAASLSNFPDFFYDVSPDGFIVPLDALLIINFLNNPGGGPEGEGDVAHEAARRTVFAEFSTFLPEDAPLRSARVSDPAARPTEGLLSPTSRLARVSDPATYPTEGLLSPTSPAPSITRSGKTGRGLAHFVESSEQNVPVPLSADGFEVGSRQDSQRLPSNSVGPVSPSSVVTVSAGRRLPRPTTPRGSTS